MEALDPASGGIFTTRLNGPQVPCSACRRQRSGDFDREALVGAYAVESVRGQLHGESGIPRVSVGHLWAIGGRSISEIPVVGERRHTSLLRLRGERE